MALIKVVILRGDMARNLIPSLKILVSSKIQMGLEIPKIQMIRADINNMVALETVKKTIFLGINLATLILKK